MTAAKSAAASYDNLENKAGATVWDEECTKKVYPSGSLLATEAAPVVPPAPTRFSTMIDCPIWVETLSNTVRAITSTAPPALKGTMARRGLEGQLCASLCSSVQNRSDAASTTST